MKLIIDIPETIYKAIKEDTYCGILDADVYYEETKVIAWMELPAVYEGE